MPVNIGAGAILNAYQGGAPLSAIHQGAEKIWPVGVEEYIPNYIPYRQFDIPAGSGDIAIPNFDIGPAGWKSVLFTVFVYSSAGNINNRSAVNCSITDSIGIVNASSIQGQLDSGGVWGAYQCQAVDTPDSIITEFRINLSSSLEAGYDKMTVFVGYMGGGGLIARASNDRGRGDSGIIDSANVQFTPEKWNEAILTSFYAAILDPAATDWSTSNNDVPPKPAQKKQDNFDFWVPENAVVGLGQTQRGESSQNIRTDVALVTDDISYKWGLISIGGQTPIPWGRDFQMAYAIGQNLTAIPTVYDFREEGVSPAGSFSTDDSTFIEITQGGGGGSTASYANLNLGRLSAGDYQLEIDIEQTDQGPLANGTATYGVRGYADGYLSGAASNFTTRVITGAGRIQELRNFTVSGGNNWAVFFFEVGSPTSASASAGRIYDLKLRKIDR